MRHPTILQAEQAVLVVVDIQEKLLRAITDAERVVANVRRLILAAKELELPIIHSEQYPKGLGPTVPEVYETIEAAELAGAPIRYVEKSTFSCTANEAFLQALEELERRQVILSGIEAHICVLQTALDLAAGPWSPFVVADAIGSRDDQNRTLALQRLVQAGVVVPVTESVLYEMIGTSRHEAFRAVSRLIK